ncbi:hypothetical protein CCHR01_15632 [Colletotrichum chrysophilum]|uniref:Tc1-like transposase DDE domain-containing protein n=1 Tax=Colletotrichum chrysophilum TaxID=1836956 RepID=A0AAD9AA32_9PEZI|nr:hypothetical protein CCHR01_15632 [Colletotrichum chrysophilum]
MAPNLAVSQHIFIRDMIVSKSLTNAQIARFVGCSTRSVSHIRSNLRCFGTTKAPSNAVGRPRTITTPILQALLAPLTEKPHIYQDEMASFIWKEFEVLVTTQCISRALASAGWTKKTIRRVAKQRNDDLRDFYLHNLSDFRSYHLVYIDESGCDKRAGHRRTGWSPKGVAPVQRSWYGRERRRHILPAYAQDGVVLSRVYQGSTDRALFEDFIAQLLCHCGKWPEPKSVLVMDNASIHHSQRLEQMCQEAGVKLIYLPPYSPDFNPIEEFFAELKLFIKRVWVEYEDLPEQDFGAFLEWCVDIVGGRKSSAEGHFRNAGHVIEEP